MRVTGIIIKDNKILLMHRIKDGHDYYVFPGGSIEEGETEEDAVRREIKEELNLGIADFKKVFELVNRDNQEKYFLIEKISGEIKLGSPEKERMNENNQYIIEWVELSKISNMENLYPREAVIKLIDFLK